MICYLMIFQIQQRLQTIFIAYIYFIQRYKHFILYKIQNNKQTREVQLHIIEIHQQIFQTLNNMGQQQSRNNNTQNPLSSIHQDTISKQLQYQQQVYNKQLAMLQPIVISHSDHNLNKVNTNNAKGLWNQIVKFYNEDQQSNVVQVKNHFPLTKQAQYTLSQIKTNFKTQKSLPHQQPLPSQSSSSIIPSYSQYPTLYFKNTHSTFKGKIQQISSSPKLTSTQSQINKIQPKQKYRPLQGIVHSNKGQFYHGAFNHNYNADGIGMYVYADGSYYYGRFVDGVYQGYGMLAYARKSRESYGNMKDKNENGGRQNRNYVSSSKLINNQGNTQIPQINNKYILKYIGYFMNGKPHGQGQQIYENGQFYIGQFVNGLKQTINTNIQCIYSWQNGDKYYGSFSKGVFSGKGKIIKQIPNQTNDSQNQETIKYIVYQGQFKNGCKNGIGYYKNMNIQFSYYGQFLNDFMHGKGTMVKINDNETILIQANFNQNMIQGQGYIYQIDMNRQNIQNMNSNTNIDISTSIFNINENLIKIQKIYKTKWKKSRIIQKQLIQITNTQQQQQQLTKLQKILPHHHIQDTFKFHQQINNKTTNMLYQTKIL